MLRKGQEGHVRAERDILKSASLVHSPGGAEWIVRLYYSFQDRDNLYLVSGYGSLFPSLPWVFLILISFPGYLLFSLPKLQVLEYMGGGDLLNLLIERDVFEEDFTRFYISEVILTPAVLQIFFPRRRLMFPTQMILAISSCHRHGFIHRDIKPDVRFWFPSLWLAPNLGPPATIEFSFRPRRAH